MPEPDAAKNDPAARPARPARRRWLVLGAFGLVVLVLGLTIVRLSSTAEGIVLLSDDDARAEVCRALPGLAPWRRDALLARLLDDPSEAVRLAAIEACARIDAAGALSDELDTRLAALATEPHATDALRAKALSLLLRRPTLAPPLVEYLHHRTADATFRQDYPSLVARWAAHRLPDATPDEKRETLAACLDTLDGARVAMRSVALEHVDDFAFARAEMVEALAAERDFGARRFLLSMLSSIDGLMRGEDAADWQVHALEALDPNALNVYQAEWLTELRPNFQIEEYEGVTSLTLREGAGGIMSWLKGRDGTVDVGSGRFSLYVPRDGDYLLWARVYFMDKCGNSFGLYLKGQRHANFPDSQNIMRQWHWLPLRSEGGGAYLRLQQGMHEGKLEAWEDGVCLDAFTLVPAGAEPDDEEVRLQSAVPWDPRLPASISFAPQWQAQPRGTTQTVTVWVRRSTTEMREGTVRLDLPAPFELAEGGEAVHRVRFEKSNPLARTSYRVHLPQDAVGGEVPLRATYHEGGVDEPSGDAAHTTVLGEMILGAHLDWRCSGPLDPDDARHQAWSDQRELPRETVEAWARYPEKGYDSYRRHNLEYAYGPLRHVYIYMAADIEVTQDGTYYNLLTADDTAEVYIGGQWAVQQGGGGPGEGRMVTQHVTLKKGRHQVLVRIYQANKADPDDAKWLRHSQNHCTFKWLLREDRHQPASDIHGQPGK